MNSDLVVIGEIVRARGNGFFEVALENGKMVMCRPNGKMMSIARIRLTDGDRVRVRFSCYDLDRGVIIYRL